MSKILQIGSALLTIVPSLVAIIKAIEVPGNGVATLVVSKWCGDLDETQLQLELAKGSSPAAAAELQTAEVRHG